nr:heavy metal-associated isoprenylated plant protein 37-like [Populus alba]
MACRIAKGLLCTCGSKINIKIQEEDEPLSTHKDFVLSLHKTLYKWRRIEEKGVYSVNIKTEHQLVIVSGPVDSATLIKKLVKSGKRAELWSLRTKNKRNQEQLNANQLQFLANDFSDLKNQSLYPASFDNETGNTRSCGDFLNQNVELKAMNVGRGQDLMAATRMGNFYMDGDNFAGSGRSGDDFAYMMGHADYQDSGTGFAGLGGHEFNGIQTYEQTYRPSMIMSNKQQRYHHNHPATEMHNIYMQEQHTGNNMMTNDNFRYQPYMIDHASSTYPPNTDYHLFHAMPYPCN